MATMKWQPPWWNEHQATAWERVKEAMRRDWEQTRHDLHAGGHELNQKLADTAKQMTGKEPIPANDGPNPPKVIGELSWDEIELPVEYGYSARDRLGSNYQRWSPELELRLRSEWETTGPAREREWRSVRDHVRRGYEYPRSR